MKKEINLDFVKKLYYEEHKTLKEVSLLIGLSSETIRKFMIKNNLPIKNKNSGSKNRKCSVNENYFEKIDSPSKAYLLGLLYADGYLNEKTYKICLSSKDIELIDFFKKELMSTHKISDVMVFDKRTNKSYRKCTLQISSKKIITDLKKIGLSQNKSFTCELPNIPDDLFWHFFRGLFDGDGTIYHPSNKPDGVLYFSLIGSEKMLTQLSSKLMTYNINPNSVHKTKYKNDEGVICTISICNYDNLILLFNNMYSESDNIRLTRKYEKFLTLKKHTHDYSLRSLKLKKIDAYSLNGEYIKTYHNIHDICKELNIKSGMVYAVINGKRNHTKGYRFNYSTKLISLATT